MKLISVRFEGRGSEPHRQRVQNLLFPGNNRSHSWTQQAHPLWERGNQGIPSVLLTHALFPATAL